MRVLQVNKFLHRRGGAEAAMLDTSALLRAAGHEVAHFAMQHPDNAPDPHDRHFPSSIELEPPPTGPVAQAQAAGRIVWSTSAARGMARVLDDAHPDVVHLHNIYHQLSPSILRPVARRGIPMVMTLHDYKLACPTYQLLRPDGSMCDDCTSGSVAPLLRHRCKGGSLASSSVLAFETLLHRSIDAYGCVDVFVCPSEFLAELVLRSGVPAAKVEVLPNVVDAASITPRTEVPASARILVAGRLSHEKGIDVAIEAAARSGVPLSIAGDGPLRSSLERLAERSAPGLVTFHGHVPRSEVLALLRRSSALVVPSRWHENQPMTVLDAFAAAVPVIASSLGGLPALLDGGRRGVLVPHDDPDALAAATSSVVEDPTWARALGAAGRAAAEAEHSPSLHLRRLIGMYDDLCAAA